ncbi:MAG: hypothetical protein BA862_00750 [Desulfobulbaceae bacterium S3730MH12]|nr:MAG: hypothetical protein BA866_06835 [Desulfobulbaceae bacterium S5133MH15]OEU54895.1 MAG: hypothetical protein BA862_00750 [Desulfobulbaceae bacterium S3730MH12]OEU81572.1 MAG: hypothetical protein BA873_01835 [Desulfobulbaceae bacterium C00003063]
MDTRSECIDLIKKLVRPLTPVATGHPVHLKPVAVNAVIFDLYGTLLISKAGDVGPDSAVDDEQAFVQALTDGGWNREDIARQAAGGIRLYQTEIKKGHQERRRQGSLYPEIDILQVWQRVLSALHLVPEHEQSIRKLAVSYECRTNPTWPMPGMLETVATLKERGMKLGIISNAQFYTPIIFEVLTDKSPEDLGFDPDLTLWSYLKLEGKPSPVLFEHLNSTLSLQGIPPDEVLYVGNDMLKDIFPATRAGWKTALFAGDRRSLRLHRNDKRTAGLQADMIINDIRQLLQIQRK